MSLAKAAPRRQELPFLKCVVEKRQIKMEKICLLGADNVMLIDDRESNRTQPKAIFYSSLLRRMIFGLDGINQTVKSELETKMGEKT